jgi:hypothetical protein
MLGYLISISVLRDQASDAISIDNSCRDARLHCARTLVRLQPASNLLLQRNHYDLQIGTDPTLSLIPGTERRSFSLPSWSAAVLAPREKRGTTFPPLEAANRAARFTCRRLAPSGQRLSVLLRIAVRPPGQSPVPIPSS